MCHGGVTVAPRTLWAPGIKADLSPSTQVTVGGMRTETRTEAQLSHLTVCKARLSWDTVWEKPHGDVKDAET